MAAAALCAACSSNDPATWAARAEENLAAGNYRAAAIDLRNLVRHEPTSAVHRLRYGEALLGSREFESAIAELRKARELGADPADVALPLAEAQAGRGDFPAVLEALGEAEPSREQPGRLLRLRGQALLGLGRHVEAREQFEQLLRQEPDSIPGRLGLAQVRLQLEGPHGAQAELDQALQLAPGSYDVRLARGLLELQLGRLSAARAEFTHAESIARSGGRALQRATALAGLVEAELGLGDLAAAAETLERLESLIAGSDVALFLGARVAAQRGQLDEAQHALQRLLSQNPRNQPANLLMGAVAFSLGNLAQAEMYLKAAASGDREGRTARKLLAEVQLRLNKARGVLESVQALGTEADSDLLSAAGRASILVGDVRSAVDYFERSRAAAPADVARELDLAAAYLAAGRAPEALALLRGLPQGEAVDYRRERLLLLAMVQSGAPQEAIRAAQALAARAPEDPRTLLLAAAGLLAAADPGAARALIDRAIRLQPKEAVPWVSLGLLEASQGDAAAAERAFDEALRRAPGNVDALVGKAQLALASGARSDAIGYLEQARAASAQSPGVRIVLARLYLENGDLARTQRALDEARKLAPHDLQVRQLEAAVALAGQKVAAAIAAYEKLVEDFPAQPALRTALARAYLAAGRLQDAERANAAALTVEPRFWPALAFAAGLALHGSSESLDAAAGWLAKLRASAAPRWVVAVLEGDLATRRGALAQAVQHYAAARGEAASAPLVLKEYTARRAAGSADAQQPLREWLQRSPDDVRVRMALADDLQRTGDADGARREYQLILGIAPGNAPALNNLAWLELEAGQTGQALERARRAYEIDPSRPEIADTYGRALTVAGRAPEAVAILRQAQQSAPDDVEIRYHLAAALAASGSREEARDHLQAIVSAPGNPPAASRARALLEELGAVGPG